MSNVLIGTAIGDALGMPFEGLKADHDSIMKWDGDSFLPSRPRPDTYYGSNLKVDAGQYTDDTQMAIMVSESLIENKGFVPEDLAKRYIDWIVSGRARGYGKTTLTAIKALESGTHWSKSGIIGSYGNGTAMRAAPFGVYFRKDKKALIEAVKIDSNITHKSNEAEAGALAIALATYYIINDNAVDLFKKIVVNLPDSTVKSLIERLPIILQTGISADTALKILGTRADVRMTVPSALYCFIRFDNFHDAVIAAIRAGGDTDTTAAITGALCGAKYGMKGIPTYWSDKIEDRDKLIKLDGQFCDGI